MQKPDYLDIKNQLSFEKPLWITLLVLVIDACIVGLAIYFIHIGTTLSYLASQLLLALFYFQNFALLHEAGHENLHKKRWVNNLIGHYSSIFCFMPFFPWKMMHQEHHVWSGNIDKDPTMAKLKQIRETGSAPTIARFAWRSWIPLAALMQHIVFWSYPSVLWKKEKRQRYALLQSCFSIVFLATAYFVLFALFPETINFSNLWLSFVLYLVVTELVNLPHHVMMPTFHDSEARSKLNYWQQNATTRTCYYPYGFSWLTLNFNLHIEHHFFPSLPWYRLPQVRDLIKPLLADEYKELRGIGWNLKNRSRDVNDILLPEIPLPNLQS
jgi:acyl-lipid omega-6 desaturase (Delta-12 desaturase)